MEKAKKKCNPLWHYVAKNLWRYLIAAVTMGISILLDIWFPLITMGIVDNVIIGGNMGMLKNYLISILIVGFGRAASQYIKEFTCDVTGSIVARRCQKKSVLSHPDTVPDVF